jgi:hypothetical protein
MRQRREADGALKRGALQRLTGRTPGKRKNGRELSKNREIRSALGRLNVLTAARGRQAFVFAHETDNELTKPWRCPVTKAAPRRKDRSK